MTFLQNIKSPKDVKKLTKKEAEILALEIRETLLDTISKNGGHLASNLGVVELTIALHRIFDSPNDKIIWDVGHQSYVHKLLTGRFDKFSTIRQYGGLSGFTKREESPHDPFGSGHSSTSISAAAGIAQANKLKGNDNYTIAVVGDGAFTGGMVYEAMNDCADKDLKIIAILNDNEMSISKNVGGMSKYMSRFLTSQKYFRFKHVIQKVTNKIPLAGKYITSFFRKCKNLIKRALKMQTLFEDLGWDYIGVADGNSIGVLEDVLAEAKRNNRPTIVHIHTTKGKGYPLAEIDPGTYHGVGSFELEAGVSQSGECFSSVFGNILCENAEKNKNICAITAAMSSGTGLDCFAEKHPDRFFDVGIAEEHALTFSAALATEGFVPYFAVYSTFSQRCYDQIIHDAALQNLHIVLCLDRAGFSATDGPTHHGLFDVSFLCNVPNLSLYAPESFDDLKKAIDECENEEGVCAIRYPKGSECGFPNDAVIYDCLKYKDFGKNHTEFPDCVVISYGRTASYAAKAADKLSKYYVRVICLTKIKPLPLDYIVELSAGAKAIYIPEEGIKSGGVAMQITSEIKEKDMFSRTKIKIKAIDDEFVPHGSPSDLYALCGLDSKSMEEDIIKLLERTNEKT